MPLIAGTGRISRLALVCASAALIIAGCATTASYRPEIDSMKASLDEAKAAGAETLAPEEYARAEACLDILTHEATEFHPIADPTTGKYLGQCRVALQALKDKMAAARVAKKPAPPVQPPAEAPAAEMGIYPSMGTLAGALARPRGRLAWPASCNTDGRVDWTARLRKGARDGARTGWTVRSRQSEAGWRPEPAPARSAAARRPEPRVDERGARAPAPRPERGRGRGRRRELAPDPPHAAARALSSAGRRRVCSTSGHRTPR